MKTNIFKYMLVGSLAMSGAFADGYDGDIAKKRVYGNVRDEGHISTLGLVETGNATPENVKFSNRSKDHKKGLIIADEEKN